jgi:signal transduction histidine kinase
VTVLESVLTLYHPRLASAGVRVQREFADPLPVLGAPGEFRQVFSNLIINAVDAMHRGGCLLLRVRNENHPANRDIPGVRISFADSGTGISREILNRIFEPFVTTKGETGTGLGLWVTAEIVHKLSGRIRVKSRPTSRPSEATRISTVFSLFFPAYSEAPPPAQSGDIIGVETAVR